MAPLIVWLLLTLLAGKGNAVPRAGDFVGWEGESYDPVKLWGSRLTQLKQKPHQRTEKEIHAEVKCPEARGNLENSRNEWVEPLSWQPRAFLFHNFLTDKECDHIIKMARPLVKRSTVITDGNDDEVDNIRTSLGAFIPHMVDDVVTAVERKVERWTHMPMENFEYMNVLRYGAGQKYGTHIDTFEEAEPRVATVLMYLSDIQEGGETAFPESNNWADPSMEQKFGPFSDCARGHVAVKPKKGDALLFYSLMPNGTIDESSLHTGCPVISGIKWTATIWIHTGPVSEDGSLTTEPLDLDPGLCADDTDECASLAAKGDCVTEKQFMTAYCRRSCRMCKICRSGDHKCYNQNRLDAGFPKIEDVV